MCRRGLSWPILDALSSGNCTLHLVQNLCSMFAVCWVSKWSWCPGAMRLEADAKKTVYCSCFFNCNFYFYLCIGLHLSECMRVTTEYRRGNQILCTWSYRNYKNLLGCLHLIGTTKAFIITDEVAAGSQPCHCAVIVGVYALTVQANTINSHV